MVYLDLLLIGFGNVGRCFSRLLQEKSVRLRRDHGLSWRVVGIVTHRDIRFEEQLDLPVARVMTPLERLVTVDESASREDVLLLLHKHRIEKVLVVDAAARLRGHFPQMINQPAVHRLDMYTSGLMVFAMTAAAHRFLSAQFAERAVDKKYIAVVLGSIAETSGEIHLPFRLDPDNRPRQIYDPDHSNIGT